MGREAPCLARHGRERSHGRAQLESDHLLFRGDFRVKVPLGKGTHASAKHGVLALKWSEGTLSLELGDAAAKWADAIANPKSVFDKLGVKPGQKVALVGRHDAHLAQELKRILGENLSTRAGKGCAHVFFALHCVDDHARLAKFIPAIHPAGGVWALYPRGHDEVSEDSIRRAARESGLVDVKIVRYSQTHGAVRLVIPKESR